MKKLPISFLLVSIFASSLVNAKQDVRLWRHMAADIEIQASLAAVERFNNSQNKWNIIADFIPEASYTQSITAAAQSEVLPCIIEIDQPMVPNFAWRGFIKPLDNLINDDIIDSINASGKGIYQGRLYSLGALDVSLALFTRKSLIQKTGTRYPTTDNPWNKNEFMAFLDAIKETGEYKYPFDMQVQTKTEWIPYAWSAIMLSWGSDLIDRSNYRTVEGVLNSKEAIEFGEWIQYLVNKGYMDANPQNETGFINQDIAVQYAGSWDLTGFYNTFKEDLAVLPVPDFGNGTVIGGGSWHWAMTDSCQYPQAATAFISFLMTAEEQSEMSSVIGLFPTNSQAAEMTEHYSKQGKWRIVFNFSKRFAQVRPSTPAYIEISDSYTQAMSEILNGMPPEVALGLAVENIKDAFERNKNYKTKE